MTFLEKLRCLFTFGQGVVLPLPEISPDTDPYTLFELWYKEACNSGILLPESMSVSTCNADGQPSSRMVLLKEYDNDGFVFYTNYGSRKCEDLEQNSKVALLFHWNVLQRQIRIEGTVEKISREQSEAYFHSRDRGSQIGAWASKQSKVMQSDNELKERFSFFKKKFSNNEVPLPEFWGGWRVKPHNIEFWQGRASRLHDRIVFNRTNNNEWQQVKLNP